MVTLPEMPPTIAALRRDDRGYPVPAFVAWVDGKPEFRAADSRFMVRAIREKLCWVCGTTLDPKGHCFVIGPMCSVTHTTAEPPCHAECAEFSAMACPFLSKPAAVRREANMPEGAVDPAGDMIRRNPGVTCLWYCKGYSLFNDGRGGTLIEIPNPSKVRWWSQGRMATREEILESITSGLPLLECKADSQASKDELRRMVDRAMKFVPAAAL